VGGDGLDASPDPIASAILLERLAERRPDATERIAADPMLRQALVAVGGASAWLGRVCVTDPAALDVLSGLSDPDRAALTDSLGTAAGNDLGRAKRLGLLHIAARDLLGLDPVDVVATRLSALAADLLERAYLAAGPEEAPMGVIGMGKLGGGELNYASDIDIVLVCGPDSAPDRLGTEVRRFLDLARSAWRIDLDLRPEGRAGPTARSLASFEAYWERWAHTWEFQALLKSRAVAGDMALGERFERAAAAKVWGRPFGADELAEVRRNKARVEEVVIRRGLDRLEVKRGWGGIRDIEFAVQLLQLVHGRADSRLRARSTLDAISALAGGGYVRDTDASSLSEAYRFLRRVEHRLQLREDQQIHTLPTDSSGRDRLARSLGYRDRTGTTATAGFDSDLRRHQATVRAIHERLFFRPLLEAFTAAADAGHTRHALTEDAVSARLAAFGFADAERTRQAVAELTRGLSRSSQLMEQALPVLFEWLSQSPDPDRGLLGLRTLAGGTHSRGRLIALCRESPDGARQLCRLLGTGPRFARDLQHHPDLLDLLASGEFLVERSREDLASRLGSSLAWRSGESGLATGLRLFTRAESLRIASRDVLGLDPIEDTAAALTHLADVVLTEVVDRLGSGLPFAVVGMGRLGAAEMAYGSDLDLLFIHDVPGGRAGEAASAEAEAVVAGLARILGGETPATGLYRVDLGLRPEGRQGPTSRSLDAYETYYRRWALPWERQALLKARFVAGDPALGRRFSSLVERYLWETPFGPDQVLEIRRTKARMERERVPAGEDPAFHLKLGPGSLSDVEWTVQLLQLQHSVPATGTRQALHALVDSGALGAEDASVLAEAYRFCERTRNRLHLVGDNPGDSLPGQGPALAGLARSLGTTPTELREEYRRRARRARRVVERLFYGAPGPVDEAHTATFRPR